MLSINTNLSSLIAQNSLTTSTNKLNQAIERMTTGFKINHAKDNAANYSIATNLTTKIGAYMVAEDNCAMGLDMLATANGSLDQISDKLSRLRILAEQASNGTYGEQSLKAINAEANALVDEINRLYSTAEYNGISLYDKAKGAGCDMESLPEAGASGFIKEVKRRDTTNMTKLSDVGIDQALTTGTYSISTPEELAKLATMTNNGLIGSDTEFVLANDIDLSGYSNWTPIGGYNSTLEQSFQAKFDGNGYKISNLKHGTYVSGFTLIGLFGYVNQAEIKNLCLDNINITRSWGAAGGLIGEASRGSVIDNCYATGAINAELAFGGLVGRLVKGSVLSNSYADVDLIVKEGSGTYANYGGLVAVNHANIINCFATGDVTGSTEAFNLGGLVGVSSGLIRNCYATGTVTGNTCIGGLVGWLSGTEEEQIGVVENCYASGDVVLTGLRSDMNLARAGGLFGAAHETSIDNCNALGKVSTTMSDSYEINIIGSASSSIGTPKDGVVVNNCLYNEVDNTGLSICSSNVASYNNFEYSNAPSDVDISLQVGINSSSSSNIQLLMSFKLTGLLNLKNLGIKDFDYITKLDEMLNKVSSKSTEYGAAQNRLESALDEISTQYENLVSTRSTIRDADIAEVSSEYIRQQILQQASATLMATANQSPAIALQLI